MEFWITGIALVRPQPGTATEAATALVAVLAFLACTGPRHERLTTNLTGREAAIAVGIGDAAGFRAMVGAGSVVTKDVPAGVVVSGNPARVMRSL